MHIFAMEGFFMVMIYGQGTFDNYRAALAAVGLETEVSTDTAVARRCEGLLLPAAGISSAGWIEIGRAHV